MSDRTRRLVASGIAAICVALGAAAAVRPPIQFTGVTLARDEAGFVILDVDPASPASGRLQPGQRVIEINGRPVAEIDDLEPELDLYMSGEFAVLVVEDEPGVPVEMRFSSEPIGAGSATFLIVGLGVLFGIAAWAGRGLAGEALRPLAVPLAAAAAAPLLLSSLWGAADGPLLSAATLLPAGAAINLADGLIARIGLPRARRAGYAFVAVGAIAMPVALLAVALLNRERMPIVELAFLVSLGLVVAIASTLVPVAGLVVSASRAAPERARTHRADALPILLAGATPAVMAAAITYEGLDFGVAIPVIWLLVAVALLQSVGRIETLRLQRDNVVAATEAERARLAADLHDDALQQVTVLVRRLDDRGAAEDAAIARSIADRLRDVCGDLRLPILDELGAGPALEWLVERVGQFSDGEVRLERADTARPPAEVELAFFRIAQEALANAIHHGAPPILVEYEANAAVAALSITDHGAGITAASAAAAPRSGHYGLLNMRQRAEQIGAKLELGTAAEGGASIGLRWRVA